MKKKSIWDGRIGFFMSAWKDFLLISINFETNDKQKKVLTDLLLDEFAKFKTEMWGKQYNYWDA